MLTEIRSLLYDLARTLRGSVASRPKATMTHNGGFIVRAWPIGTDPGDFPIPRLLPLPLLEHLDDLQPTDWLRDLAIFGREVASFLPGNFAAYARVYHPFELDEGGGPESFSTWRDLPQFTDVDIGDIDEIGDVSNGVGGARTSVGTIPLSIIQVLSEHLGPATTSPEKCFFAVWQGFGGLALPEESVPRLELPDRGYHVFTGPLTAAQTSFDAYTFGRNQHYANLWWPADRAWCVATEIDFAWTYVGGSRECIDAVLADPHLESMETSAHAEW